MIRRFRLLLLINAALLSATLLYEIVHHRSKLSTATAYISAQSTSTTINLALHQAKEVINCTPSQRAPQFTLCIGILSEARARCCRL